MAKGPSPALPRARGREPNPGLPLCEGGGRTDEGLDRGRGGCSLAGNTVIVAVCFYL